METDELVKILGTGLLSAVLSGLLSHILTGLRDKKKELSAQQRDGRYLAIRVAVALEEFTIECADRISDNLSPIDEHVTPVRQWTGFPKLPAYPTDADWKVLPANLLNDALAFRNEILVPEKGITFLRDVAEIDDAVREFNKHAKALGLQAWKIAAAFRKAYDLPEANRLIADWDFLEYLGSAPVTPATSS